MFRLHPVTAEVNIPVTWNLWRGIDLGTSSALAYLLLFVVTVVALVFVNFVRQRLLETI